MAKPRISRVSDRGRRNHISFSKKMIKLSSLIYIYIPNFGWMGTPSECLAKRKNWILGELLLISTRSSYHFTWAWIKWSCGFCWNIIWHFKKFDKLLKYLKKNQRPLINPREPHIKLMCILEFYNINQINLCVGIYIHNSILTNQVGSWSKHQFNHVLDIPQLSWCRQLCTWIGFENIEGHGP